MKNIISFSAVLLGVAALFAPFPGISQAELVTRNETAEPTAMVIIVISPAPGQLSPGTQFHLREPGTGENRKPVAVCGDTNCPVLSTLSAGVTGPTSIPLESAAWYDVE